MLNNFKKTDFREAALGLLLAISIVFTFIAFNAVSYPVETLKNTPLSYRIDGFEPVRDSKQVTVSCRNQCTCAQKESSDNDKSIIPLVTRSGDFDASSRIHELESRQVIIILYDD